MRTFTIYDPDRSDRPTVQAKTAARAVEKYIYDQPRSGYPVVLGRAQTPDTPIVHPDGSATCRAWDGGEHRTVQAYPAD